MFRKSTSRWMLVAVIILAMPSAIGITQPQVSMAQVNPVNKISPPETEGLELLSKSCRDAILEMDQQVAQWIEEYIVREGLTEPSADLEYIRRRFITFEDFIPFGGPTLFMSNPSAVFGPPELLDELSSLSYEKSEKEREKEYVYISQRLASACPEINAFSFSSFGSYQKWTMRRTGFSVVYDRFTVTLDDNALVGLESCRKPELDSFIDSFRDSLRDYQLVFALPPESGVVLSSEEYITTKLAEGEFLGLPVDGIIVANRECRGTGCYSLYRGRVLGVIFDTPFANARYHLARHHNLPAFKAKLLPDPTNENRSILMCPSDQMSL